MYFNVKNTIVSQDNPHIHFFLYAPRGSVGRPVTHRNGKNWRDGFLVASIEQYYGSTFRNIAYINGLERR